MFSIPQDIKALFFIAIRRVKNSSLPTFYEDNYYSLYRSEMLFPGGESLSVRTWRAVADY